MAQLKRGTERSCLATALHQFGQHSQETRRFIQEVQEEHEGQDLYDGQRLSSGGFQSEIEEAVQQTIPTQEDRLNRSMFNLCRKLQGMDGLESATEDTLEPLIRQWHKAALCRIPTLSFTAVWAEFQYCWEKVKYPEGEIFNQALELAQTVYDHPEQQYRYDDDKARLLVRLCYNLQELGNDKTFFLGFNQAGKALKCSHTWAGKLLNMLVKDKILVIVNQPTKGPTHSKSRATVYQFMEENKDA